jgi:hypothetical protein
MQITRRLARGFWAPTLLIGLGFLGGCGQPVPVEETGNPGGTTGETSTGGSTGVGTLTVSAGGDQTVADGVTVTLTGSATNTTGAAVAFLWTQVSGPPVTLNGSDTATATFTSPDVSTTLLFSLIVTSGGGQANDQVTVTVQAAPILFVANRAGNSITNYRADSTLNGDVVPQGVIGGTAALVGPASLVLDKTGGILATNTGDNSIAGFPNVLTSTGVAPDRLVKGATTLLNDPEGAAYDRTNDLLFVANFNGVPSEVTVYANASRPAFTGDIAPTRSFSSVDGIINPRALVLAQTGELYVVNAGSSNVAVFPNVVLMSGSVPASRTITSTEMDNHVLLDAFLDTQDNLFVTDSTGKRVLMFASASTLGAGATPAEILTPSGAITVTGIVVDAVGTGYITDSDANAIYIFTSIAQRSGTLSPERILSGLNTQLSQPWHMTVLQR